MKRVLYVCLGVNLVVLALLGWNRHQRHELAMTRLVRSSVVEVKDPSPMPTPPAPTPRPERSNAWHTVESKDLSQFLAHLRAVGCPEQTIRDLITFRVCRAFRQQVLEQERAAAMAWDGVHPQDPNDWWDRRWKRHSAQDGMDTELERLLGAGAEGLKATVFGAVVGLGVSDEHLGHVAFEKRGAVREVERRYQQQLQAAKQALLPGESDPSVDLAVKEVSAKREAELKALLTPEEWQAHYLRASESARYVLTSLPQAKSEDEFRRMVEAVDAVGADGLESQSLGRRYRLPGGPERAEEDRKIDDHQARLDAQLRAVLGDQRVAEQQAEESQRKIEEERRQEEQQEARAKAPLISVAQSLGIGAEETDRFYQRVKDSTDSMSRRMDDLAKTLEGNSQKEDLMKAAVREELEKIATETVGEKGSELVRKLLEREKP